jgi:hypothetical protein
MEPAALISVLALAVSSGSLVVSFLSWRTSGPRAILRVVRVTDQKLLLTVANSGRLGVPVKAVEAHILFVFDGVRHSVEPVELDGPLLPFVVAPGDDQEWDFQLPTGYDAARVTTASSPAWIRVKCGARWEQETVPDADRTR